MFSLLCLDLINERFQLVNRSMRLAPLNRTLRRLQLRIQTVHYPLCARSKDFTQIIQNMFGADDHSHCYNKGYIFLVLFDQCKQFVALPITIQDYQ